MSYHYTSLPHLLKSPQFSLKLDISTTFLFKSSQLKLYGKVRLHATWVQQKRVTTLLQDVGIDFVKLGLAVCNI